MESLFGDGCVISRLVAQPPAIAQAKVAAQPQVGICCHGALARDNFINAFAGTPMSLAKRYFVKPGGLRNSSSSISPGETGATVRMVFSLYARDGLLGLMPCF
jgi:hypothetical protein